MSQVRYTQDQTRAFAGMKADLGNDYVISRASEGGIAFGFGVEEGTASDQVVTFAGGTFLGVAVHTHNEDGSYPDGDSAGILRKGQVWVRLESGQTPAVGGAVYCTDATGDFRTDATGGTLVNGAVYMSVNVDSSSHSEVANNDGAVALVEFNLPA